MGQLGMGSGRQESTEWSGGCNAFGKPKGKQEELSIHSNKQYLFGEHAHLDVQSNDATGTVRVLFCVRLDIFFCIKSDHAYRVVI